jgi:hypothetical protein
MAKPRIGIKRLPFQKTQRNLLCPSSPLQARNRRTESWRSARPLRKRLLSLFGSHRDFLIIIAERLTLSYCEFMFRRTERKISEVGSPRSLFNSSLARRRK